MIERHASCVLRHILHRNGPESWANVFTDIPFIVARGRDGVRLVSLRTARRRPVYLPDVRDHCRSHSRKRTPAFFSL